jgi:hypothetical protein
MDIPAPIGPLWIVGDVSDSIPHAYAMRAMLIRVDLPQEVLHRLRPWSQRCRLCPEQVSVFRNTNRHIAPPFVRGFGQRFKTRSIAWHRRPWTDSVLCRGVAVFQ